MPNQITNDYISETIEALNIVPPGQRGNDLYLDIVSWNIRYFHDKDSERVERISRILNALNADIIVCQEIKDGSMEAVSDRLADLGAGYYEVNYGQTGGNQRICIMHDLDWVRTKCDVEEIFHKGQHIAKDGKDAFPRLPLRGYFTCLAADTYSAPFDFQLLGLHLKSQWGGGKAQRRKSAEVLCKWLEDEAPLIDSDVLLLGDWNMKPTSTDWKPFHKLEDEGTAMFKSINDSTDFSHFYYKNKKNLGSKLDLAAITVAAHKYLAKAPKTVRWTTLDKFLDANPKAKEIKEYIKQVRDKISDHMPVLTRFYFKEPS